MSKNTLIFAALSLSLVFAAGCGASPDGGALEPEPTDVARQELAASLVQVEPSATGATLAYGHCNGDGYVVQGGEVVRLGAVVGSDATGVTAGASACHNTGVWTLGAMYVCNSNQGTRPAGTYTGPVPAFDEPFGRSRVQYPASVATDGLNFAHAQLLLCETPSGADYTLVSVECCAAPATP